jgi:anti-anti-sigma factor
MREPSPRSSWPAPAHRVETVTDAAGVSITLSGEIDMLAQASLEEAAQTAIARQPADVVVDLGGVTFLGSQALSFLVRLHQATAGQGAATILRRVPRSVRTSMVTVGLDTLFPTVRETNEL